MNNYSPPTFAETYKYHEPQISGNIFQLIGDLFDEIKETTEARKKVIREIVEDSMSFKINLYEKLALHFSREAMLAERKRKTFLDLYDQITFSKPPSVRW